MIKDRKEYRKKYNAHGLLQVGGETLHLNCYDVSVKGAMFEITPGLFLSSYEDFTAFVAEERSAEIFIEDLMMSGEVSIVWVKQNRNRIMLGVEFVNVTANFAKLWRKRRHYRKKQCFSAELVLDKDRLKVELINCSLEGACLHMSEIHPSLKVGALVKLHIKDIPINAIGKVVWMKHDGDVVLVGLQTLTS